MRKQFQKKEPARPIWLQPLGDHRRFVFMSKQRKEARELLSVAARFHGFAREASDVCYRNRFRSGAFELEIEAVGCAAANAVAHALRKARTQFHTAVPC